VAAFSFPGGQAFPPARSSYVVGFWGTPPGPPARRTPPSLHSPGSVWSDWPRSGRRGWSGRSRSATCRPAAGGTSRRIGAKWCSAEIEVSHERSDHLWCVKRMMLAKVVQLRERARVKGRKEEEDLSRPPWRQNRTRARALRKIRVHLSRGL